MELEVVTPNYEAITAMHEARLKSKKAAGDGVPTTETVSFKNLDGSVTKVITGPDGITQMKETGTDPERIFTGKGITAADSSNKTMLDAFKASGIGGDTKIVQTSGNLSVTTRPNSESEAKFGRYTFPVKVSPKNR